VPDLSTRAGRRRYLRFAIVGLFNTAFGYGLYLGLLWLGLPYWLAWGGALVAALAVGFVLSGRFVFGPAHPARFILYVLAWIAIYALNLLLIEGLFLVGIGPALAPILILPVNVVLSYAVQKRIVYRSI